MNINGLLVLIFLGLAMIYFLFDPMKIKKLDSKEVPLFSLNTFTLYELDTIGLTGLMQGSRGTRYSDRYEVKNIDYTDNSNEFMANMKAKDGLYKKDVVHLNGNVFFTRTDGLRYFSQKAVYNKKTDVSISDTDYVASMGDNQIYGDYILYDAKNEKMKSNKIYAIYKIKETK